MDWFEAEAMVSKRGRRLEQHCQEPTPSNPEAVAFKAATRRIQYSLKLVLDQAFSGAAVMVS